MNQLDAAFIELLAARTLTVTVESPAALDSLRVMMYRKLQAHIAQWDAIGHLSDDLSDTTVSVAVDKKKNIAVLSIIKRKPKLQFKIIPNPDSNPDSGTPDHADVPTNLEHDQVGQIQHGSSSASPQGHGTDADSSSPQGESNGQCVAAEDWESELRKFIESDSPAQN